MIVEDYEIRVQADTEGLKRGLTDVSRLSRSFGASLSSAFDQAVVKGRDLGAVLRSLALRLSSQAFDAAMRPVERGAASLFANLLSAALPFAKGGVIAPGGVQPFARGGVIAEPTYFSAGRAGLGLMGEAGAEAIMPLTRGADGRLGVRADGGATPSVSVVIQTPDPESFSRARGRIAADLARAVDRGRRHL